MSVAAKDLLTESEEQLNKTTTAVRVTVQTNDFFIVFSENIALYETILTNSRFQPAMIQHRYDLFAQ